MENVIEVTAIINGGIKLILTSENAIGSQLLSELDGAVCKLKQNTKLDDNINVEYALVIEKKLESMEAPKRKTFFDFLKWNK